MVRDVDDEVEVVVDVDKTTSGTLGHSNYSQPWKIDLDFPLSLLVAFPRLTFAG